MVIFIGMIMLAIVAAMLGFGFGYDNGWHNASDYLDDALDVVNDWKRRCREAEDRLEQIRQFLAPDDEQSSDEEAQTE